MALKRIESFFGLPPFRSPRSKAVTEARQRQRVYLAKLEWGAPIGQPPAPSDQPVLRAPLVPEHAVELMMDEPPQLDIGEPALHLPGSGLDVTNIDNQFYLRMPGRPSPSCTSRQDLDMATHTGGVSPSRSPRLPSPPPFTEVQIGPKSPTIGASATGNEHELGGVNKPDIGATRRIRPGTKAADMASGPPLVPLAEVSSQFSTKTSTKPPSSTLPSNYKNTSKPSIIPTPNPPPQQTQPP